MQISVSPIQRDFVSSSDPEPSAECGFQRMLGGMAITGYYHPQFTQTHVKDQWLFILDALETVGRCDMSKDVLEGRRKRWLRIGKDMKLDPEVGRKDQVSQLQDEMAGLVGCCWIRCPLFQQDSVVAEREVLRCAGCRKVRLTRPVGAEC